MKRAAEYVRKTLLAAASNVSLFVVFTFFVTGLLILGPDVWWREHVNMLESYVIIPWGMALCLLRLERRVRMPEQDARWDLRILFVLLGWIIVPFAIRFGNTFNNSGSWHNHTVLFFGLYALLSEQTAEERESLFDLGALLFSLFSLVLGVCLLYCAYTMQVYDESTFSFGLMDGMFLCANTHYNTTGMVAVCCTLMTLAGLFRMRSRPMKGLCLAAAVAMTLVTLLTQSRTARYALIAAYALGVYGYLSANARLSRAWLRHAAGIAAAAVLAAASFGGAMVLDRVVIAHYNAEQGKPSAMMAHASAQEQAVDSEAQAEQEAPVVEPAKPLEARVAVDESFSGRTAIWRNLFNRWKEYPKYFLIGHGITRIGQLVTANTIHEGREAVAIHNAYLQYIADYGLIGFVLLLAFLAVAAVPALRVFFARGDEQKPGYRVLCMIVFAGLLIGMMESSPLGAMSPVNMMMFYAMALLTGRGRDIKK